MLFLYCNLRGNLGDGCCSPKHYFAEWFHEPELYPQRERPIDNASTGPIIIGGGGMFFDGSAPIFDLIADAGRPVAVWGAGTNFRPRDHEIWFPPALDKYALVGVRDFGQKYEYLPCASCLHESFNINWAPQVEFMVYSHYDLPIPVDAPIAIRNCHSSMWEAVRELSLARTIITNSYHGAYWGMLLGRRVLAFDPPWNKFMGLKHQPEYCDGTNWKEKVEGPPGAPSGFLDECRALNMDFYRRVKALL